MSNTGVLKIRPIGPEDQEVLWDLLHVALWDPPPAALRPREVLQSPGVRIYAESWGREGDVGVIGEIAGEPRPVGGCWMRLILNQQGLAYVDDATPQIGIALFPPFQGRGYGKRLMAASLEAARAHGYSQISLTVHPQNPAGKMYEGLGFKKIGQRSGYDLMLVSLWPETR